MPNVKAADPLAALITASKQATPGPATRNLALLADRTALGDAPEWRHLLEAAPDA